MRITILVLVILFQSLSHAQGKSKLRVYESTPYIDRVKNDDIDAIYISTSGRTGVIRNNKKSIILDVFDENLRFDQFISVPIDRRETYIGGIFYDDEIKVFTESFPRKDVKILTCYTFGLNDKSQQKIELSTTNFDRKLSVFSNKKGASYSISPNQKHFAVTNYTIHRDEIFYHISVFDSKTYKLIYDTQVSRNDNDFFTLYETHIDDKKNVYVLGESLYDAESPKRRSEINRRYIIEKINQDNYAAKELKLEDKYIKSLKPVINDKMYNLYGLYSEYATKDRISGVCNILIDMDEFEILEKNMQGLPSQVYFDLFGVGKAEKKIGKELANSKIDFILNDDAQNVYLLAEKFYISSQVNNMMGDFAGTGPSFQGYGGTNQIEHYDDILIIKFSPEGKLDWGRSIYRSEMGSSYNAFLKEGNLHVILNSGKNLRELKDGRTKASTGLFESTALYDFKYKNDGEEVITKIQNNTGRSYYLPSHGNYVGDRFVMMNDARKERRFMTLQ